MPDNRPPNRPDYRKARSAEPFANDRDRAKQARQAAEALFAPKPRLPEKPAASIRPAQEPRKPAAPDSSPPPSLRAPSTAGDGDTLAPKSKGRAIPTAHLARIRTWLKYGMRIAEVAEVYGVDVGEIERALGKS